MELLITVQEFFKTVCWILVPGLMIVVAGLLAAVATHYRLRSDLVRIETVNRQTLLSHIQQQQNNTIH